jgi:hypothetical protein
VQCRVLFEIIRLEHPHAQTRRREDGRRDQKLTLTPKRALVGGVRNAGFL